MLATAKHFVGYGASEGGRDYATAEISERTFWETYIPPFKSAIDAGVGAVMPAFSAVNGSPPHASAWMLRDVLRGRLGFHGLVVSDWSGIEELVPHGVARTTGDAAKLAIRAGVDVDMADGVYPDSLLFYARTNSVLRRAVDDAVRHVLRTKYELGLFTDPYHGASEARAARVTLSAAHVAAARTAAREAIVLLKNEQIDASADSRSQVARGDRRACNGRAELARSVVDRGARERRGDRARRTAQRESLDGSAIRARRARGWRGHVAHLTTPKRLRATQTRSCSCLAKMASARAKRRAAPRSSCRSRRCSSHSALSRLARE